MTETETERVPKFHITGERGWINDPNGLAYFRGEYHVFFQYYPYATHWGPMHWGHVASKDLRHWRRLPVALFPDQPCDRDGCFSGSAIVWNDRLWLLYTGFTENGGGEKIRQLQCLASSEDGEHFVKHGIVIGEEDLPKEYCPWDFRDPKVWKRDDGFYCVVAARYREGRGRVLLFRSDDLMKWKFVGDLFGEDSRGTMTECPDLLEDEGLLTVCEQFQPREGKTHLNVHSSRWYTGRFDGAVGRFYPEKEGIVDYGFDFYAQQTFCNAPVMIGWLDMWDRNNPSARYGFAGMLTVPRKIGVRNGELVQTPIVDGKTVVSATADGTLTDRATTGILRIAVKGLKSFRLSLRKGEGCETTLTLGDGEWIFDRSRSGEPIAGVEKDEDSLAGIRRMPRSDGGETELTVVLDRYSVEIFIDGKALSAAIYPPAEADAIELCATADECRYERSEIE